MKEYKGMLEEYGRSIERLQERINELSGRIRQKKYGADETERLLTERRYKLYQMVWEMQESVREIEDYIESVQARESAGMAGERGKRPA